MNDGWHHALVTPGCFGWHEPRATRVLMLDFLAYLEGNVIAIVLPNASVHCEGNIASSNPGTQRGGNGTRCLESLTSHECQAHQFDAETRRLVAFLPDQNVRSWQATSILCRGKGLRLFCPTTLECEYKLPPSCLSFVLAQFIALSSSRFCQRCGGQHGSS